MEYPPQKNGWVKYLKDHSMEYGYDCDVDRGMASWTRGGQKELAGVAIKTNDLVFYLVAPEGETGKFWQSDDYEVVLGSRKPVRIIRRIEQKVGDKSWKIIEINTQTMESREFISKHKI